MFWDIPLPDPDGLPDPLPSNPLPDPLPSNPLPLPDPLLDPIPDPLPNVLPDPLPESLIPKADMILGIVPELLSSFVILT